MELTGRLVFLIRFGDEGRSSIFGAGGGSQDVSLSKTK